MTAPAAPNTPSWFDLACPDPDAAEAFYGPLFGWTFEAPAPEEMGSHRSALLDGRPVAGLGKIPEGMPMPPAWSIYFRSDDLEANVEAATAAGGKVVAPPMVIPGAGRMALLADPGGAVFGLWENGAHVGALARDEAGAMTRCEVNTPDREQAAAFYGTLFGTEARPMQGMAYTTMHHGDDPDHGILQMTEEWAGVPPHWMVYFRVADTDAAAATLAELGGKVCFPAFDTPYGRIAVVEDPFGAVFSLLSR